MADELKELPDFDLGLGEGLKPGALCVNKTEPTDTTQNSGTVVLNTTLAGGLNVAHSHGKAHKFLEKIKIKRRSKSLQETSSNKEGSTAEEFPTYNDVPLGTSLQQQKQLLTHELQKLNDMHSYKDHNGTMVSTKDEENSSHNIQQSILLERLHKAQMDVEILKQDLEMCHKKLEAKYEAIKILQQQVLDLQEQKTEITQKEKDLNRVLQQEVNKLQFEMECQQSRLMDSQETWAERFDKICQDNASLRTTLDERLEGMRRLQAANTALKRDRDELLAMIDVQERHRYESLKSCSSDDDYNTFTATQLAVLGACHCRERDPDPCGCAKAAANLKRQLACARQQIEQYKNGQEEAITTTDAYRIAFEEQLTRNRALMGKLASLEAFGTYPSRKMKIRNVISFLIKQLNEDATLPANQPRAFQPDHMEENQEIKDQDLIQSLLEVISERSEALAHQRLAARMLASKNEQLEQQLTKTTSDEVFHEP